MRTLVNVNSGPELRAIEEVFDRLFGAPVRSGAHAPTGLPLDILEREGNLVIRASVPGVDPSDLDIQVQKNVLTIRGESRTSTETKDEKVYQREIGFGSFSRSIRLPEGFNLGEVTADFANGIVTITIPRQPEEKPQSVKVNVRSLETAPSN